MTDKIKRVLEVLDGKTNWNQPYDVIDGTLGQQQQLDELSKKTLTSYNNTAVKDVVASVQNYRTAKLKGNHPDKEYWGKRANKRGEGARLALKKLTHKTPNKKSAPRVLASKDLDEVTDQEFRTRLSNKANKATLADKHGLSTRLKNMAWKSSPGGSENGKLKKRLSNVKEDALLEVSKKVLGSYVTKAASAVRSHTLDDAKTLATGGGLKKADAHAHKAHNRIKGIHQAVKRLTEGVETDDSMVHELMLHGDNDSHLYNSSKKPILANLQKKAAAGKYDHEKAKKLWGYHADRAAHSYHKESGVTSEPWHKMFSPAIRKKAASAWADQHKNGEE